jgi:hypothetical protein
LDAQGGAEVWLDWVKQGGLLRFLDRLRMNLPKLLPFLDSPGSMPKTKAAAMLHKFGPQGSQKIDQIFVNVGVIGASVLVGCGIGDQPIGRGFRVGPRPGDNFTYVKTTLSVCQGLAFVVEPVRQISVRGIVIVDGGHIARSLLEESR